MADTKISAMTTASTLTGGEIMPLVQSGANVQNTVSNILNQGLGVTTVAQLTATQLNASGVKTSGLTGYLYGNDATGNITASTTIPFSAVASQPWIEVADVTSNFNLTTTPTILTGTSTPAANLVTVSGSGITYDPTTGIFTFAYAGSYSLAISVNCLASNSSQSIYWYAENNTGSGWTTNTNSGKSFALTNGARTQVLAANAVTRVAGQQVRYYFYASGTGVNINHTTLPSSTAVVPGIRIQYAG